MPPAPLPAVWSWTRKLRPETPSLAAQAAQLYRQERRLRGKEAELVQCLRQVVAMSPLRPER
ncbi:MAG TPA: hypothetical protein VNZ61_16190 [Roseomonas sp.]|nr:hypothetical protein [Roseomonas sp.]